MGRWLLPAAAAATAGFGFALALGWEPGVPGEWVWRAGAVRTNLLPSIAGVLALTALTAALCRPGRWESLRPAARAGWLGALVLVVFVFQLALLNASGLPWIAQGAVIASPVATTYFGVSLGVEDPAQWLARYPDLMRALPHHAPTHPPGFVLFFVLIRRICASLSPQGDWLSGVAEQYRLFGMDLTPADALAAIVSAGAVALIGALSLPALYALAARQGGARLALCSACMAAAMPGLLLLGASSDLIVMTLAVVALWLGYGAWRSGSLVGAGLAGLTVALGLFVSLAFGLVAAIAAAWVIFGAARVGDRAAAVGRAAKHAAAAGLAFGAFYLVLYLVWDYRPIAVAREALAAHREVTTVSFARAYWKWVLMNPLECAIFVGLPLTISALWSWRSVRWSQLPRLGSLLIAWLVVMAVLDLSGIVRGEVGRIWLFLLWPAALAAGAYLSRRSDAARLVPLLVLFQAAQAVAMRGYLTIYSIL